MVNIWKVVGYWRYSEDPDESDFKTFEIEVDNMFSKNEVLELLHKHYSNHESLLYKDTRHIYTSFNITLKN